MREILFRGKRIDTGEWVYGFLYETEKTSSYNAESYILEKERLTINYKCVEGITTHIPFVQVTPDTVGQYTGLTDKNGKKIFEGDIYTWKDDCGDYHACTICFGEYFDGYADRRATMANGFYVKTLQGETYNFAGFGYSEIEISGNIHDNPELLDNSEMLEDKP